MTLSLTTAGESHGPALVGIVTGLPAGLVLDRDAIDADLHRRRQGYGRSPRQKLEQDEVEVLAGLRHGVTLGTPLALVMGGLGRTLPVLPLVTDRVVDTVVGAAVGVAVILVLRALAARRQRGAGAAGPV